jgi:hypothetical protein
MLGTADAGFPLTPFNSSTPSDRKTFRRKERIRRHTDCSEFMKKATLGIFVIGLFTGITSHAGLIFSIEGAGVQASTVPGITTETFDSGSPGAFSGSVAMGSLNAGGAKVAADSFGGAFDSQYYALGVQSGFTAATLSLTTPQNYLGIWWSAGDGRNRLEFYDGATLLGSYRVFDITPFLGAAYYGNPNDGSNAGEPYVYLNFTTTGGNSITELRLLNDSTAGGFEIDNISVTTQRINPPGILIPTPDSGSTVALFAGAVALVCGLRRSTKN